MRHTLYTAGQLPPHIESQKIVWREQPYAVVHQKFTRMSNFFLHPEDQAGGELFIVVGPAQKIVSSSTYPPGKYRSAFKTAVERAKKENRPKVIRRATGAVANPLSTPAQVALVIGGVVLGLGAISYFMFAKAASTVAAMPGQLKASP